MGISYPVLDQYVFCCWAFIMSSSLHCARTLPEVAGFKCLPLVSSNSSGRLWIRTDWMKQVECFPLLRCYIHHIPPVHHSLCSQNAPLVFALFLTSTHQSPLWDCHWSKTPPGLSHFWSIYDTNMDQQSFTSSLYSSCIWEAHTRKPSRLAWAHRCIEAVLRQNYVSSLFPSPVGSSCIFFVVLKFFR